MIVSEVMTRGAAVVAPDSSLFDAARLMRDHGVGALPVVEGALVVGILTDRDIVVRAIAKETPNIPVRKIMSKAICCVGPDEDINVAAKIMARERIHRMPVVRNGELLGIVTLGDIAAGARREAREHEVLADASPPVSHRALH